tara:strand:+ start:205 stop:597 length:393 start_codon:yes stop_codon:yes gene_type:complete
MNDIMKNEEGESDDLSMQMTSAAISIRAIEKVNGDGLTQGQFQMYLSNYNGKYPLKIVEAGMGLLLSLRKPVPKSFLGRLFSSPPRVDPNNKMDVLIEQGADHVLSLLGARKEIEWLLKHEMTYPPSSNI